MARKRRPVAQTSELNTSVPDGLDGDLETASHLDVEVSGPFLETDAGRPFAIYFTDGRAPWLARSIYARLLEAFKSHGEPTQ